VPSLRELQERFYDAVLLGDPAVLDPLRADDSNPATPLDVSKSIAHEPVRKALSCDYPVIEQLVGEHRLGRLALIYMREHRSLGGDAQGFGSEFAAFLARRYSGGPYDYLADVARLEWAYQEVLIAPDAQTVGVDSLATLAADQLERLRLRLHPAGRIVRSRYPILSIWQMSQSDADPDTSVELAGGGEAVLLRRLENHVELRLLASGDAALLAALQDGAVLGDAVDAALAETADFDLQRALARAFALGLIVHCSLAQFTDPAHRGR
jgi:hypothetical protein